MRQLLLDLPAEKPQTLDTFVAGQNTELVLLAQRLLQGAPASLDERFVYLWGESGAGKSHLLHALATAPASRYIPSNAPSDAFTYHPDATLYLLDDCDRLPPQSQIDAFNLFNQVRERGGCMVATGPQAPLALTVREDLRTRFGWGLVYQVHGLSDDEKIAALTQAAQARGFTLSPGVLPYLITHYRRDMRSLAGMLDALDQYSLETQRPVTLPLLRSLLQLEADAKA